MAAGSVEAQWARAAVAAGMGSCAGALSISGGDKSGDWLHDITSLREFLIITISVRLPFENRGGVFFSLAINDSSPARFLRSVPAGG